MQIFPHAVILIPMNSKNLYTYLLQTWSFVGCFVHKVSCECNSCIWDHHNEMDVVILSITIRIVHILCISVTTFYPQSISANIIPFPNSSPPNQVFSFLWFNEKNLMKPSIGSFHLWLCFDLEIWYYLLRASVMMVMISTLLLWGQMSISTKWTHWWYIKGSLGYESWYCRDSNNSFNAMIVGILVQRSNKNLCNRIGIVFSGQAQFLQVCFPWM